MRTLKKKLLTAALLSAVILPTTGCVNLGKVVRELSKDPAVFKIQLTTIYGNLNISRAGSNTNSVRITSEGEVVNNPPAPQPQ